MMTPDWAFRSDHADVEDVWGWFDLPAGLEMTRMPLHDTRSNLFARLGGGAAAACLASKGWRLPRVREYDALHVAGLHVEPYVLPTSEPHLILDAGIALHDGAMIERFRETHMMGRPWCALHDAEVMRRIVAAGFNGSQPVDNAGKHWAEPDEQHPAAPGHSLIYGWWTPRARSYGVHNDVMIQEPSDFHDLAYVDYATTFHAVRAKQ